MVDEVGLLSVRDIFNRFREPSWLAMARKSRLMNQVEVMIVSGWQMQDANVTSALPCSRQVFLSLKQHLLCHK